MLHSQFWRNPGDAPWRPGACFWQCWVRAIFCMPEYMTMSGRNWRRCGAEKAKLGAGKLLRATCGLTRGLYREELGRQAQCSHPENGLRAGGGLLWGALRPLTWEGSGRSLVPTFHREVGLGDL